MKLVRKYVVTAAILLCLTSATACVFIADENARRIGFGLESVELVVGAPHEKFGPDALDALPIIRKTVSAIKKAASLAPPPVGNIYWFAVNLKNLNY